MEKFKHRVKSWKELEQFGKSTELGLFLPTGIHGLEDTKILFDEEDENEFLKELAAEERKRHKGQIISVGIMG